jgi:translocation and assembly module TamB
MKPKPIVGWTLAVIATLMIVLPVGGLLYLRSGLFHNYVLKKLSDEAYTATGAKTQVQSFDFSLSGLTATLYNITMHGAEPPNSQTLLHVDKLTVRFKILSLLHQKVNLREILIEHPVVHMLADTGGKTNLPQAPASQGSSQTSMFDLAIGHVQLSRGEVNYNDQSIPLEADLYDLGTDVRFDSLAKSYRGVLSYTNGRLQYAHYSSLPHKLEAKFSATPEKFVLEPATLNLGASQVILNSVVSNYKNPVADGGYEIRIHTQDFAVLSPSARPAGDLQLTGKLHYQSSGNTPLLRSISVDGQLASEALSAAASGTMVNVQKLQGHYRMANGTLRIRDLSLQTLGGNISANADLQNLDATPVAEVRATLKNISLRAAQQTLHRNELNSARISGALNGTTEWSWKGSVSNAKARADLAVQAEARSTANPSAGEVPLNGVIHGTYDGAREALALQNTHLQIPSATLSAQGEVSSHSNLTIQLLAKDLHQLASLAASFNAGSSNVPALSGSASLNAVVRGTTHKPQVSGQFAAQDLAVQGSRWSSVKCDLQANPSQIAVQNGRLVNAHRGQATFEGKVDLKNWSYQPSSPLQATVSVKSLEIEELQKLASLHYPISGEITSDISMKGSQLDPKGSGSLQITNAQAYDEPLQNVNAKFKAANGTITSNLAIAAAAGSVNADASYNPKTKAYTLRLDAPEIVLQKLRTLKARNLAISGTVTASANGEGTIDHPQLTASVSIPKLGTAQATVGAFKADVRVADQKADFSLQSNIDQAPVKAYGRLDLTGDYYTEAAVDTGTIPLEQILAAHASGAPAGFQGQTEIHATLKGPLKNKSQVEAHLTIPTLKANYQSLDLEISAPVKADFAHSVVTLQPAEIRGTGTSLKMRGSVPISGSAAPNLVAQGSVDVRILRILAPDIQSSGVVAIDVRTSGTATKPAVNGQLQVKDVSVSTNDAPFALTKLNGNIDIGNDRVQLSNLTGQIGGGQISIAGSVAYKPSLQFNVALQGQSLRLRYPDGLRSSLDAHLAFSGTTEASSLNGRVLIDSLSFTPDFDLATFSDQFSTGTTTPSQPGFADAVKLAINVQSKQNLAATSSQVSLGGNVNLQVVGTAAQPVITGRTNLNSGELFYRNVRYQLQRGVITFDDPNETHPILNVAVNTTVEQYNLTLTLRGPLDKLTTSYVSDPPLATADIINLIARGKTTQEANASSPSTDSMIASGAASELSSSVQKLAGLSSLQIDPLLGGNNQNPSARVAIQQRVSKKFLFTFSTDVSQPGSEIVQGEYQINPRWSTTVTRDQLGGVSVDGKYHKRF